MQENQEQPNLFDAGTCCKPEISPPERIPGKNVLLLDPRPVRHTERIADLFYVLFKRDN